MRTLKKLYGLFDAATEFMATDALIRNAHIERLQAQLAEAQRREQAAVADMEGLLELACHSGLEDACDYCSDNSEDCTGCTGWRGPQGDEKCAAMDKLQALNSLKVVDFDCCDGECVYVFAEISAANIKTLLDAGFITEQIDEAMGDDKTEIDLATLAFNYTDAEWWSPQDGFTAQAGKGKSDA